MVVHYWFPTYLILDALLSPIKHMISDHNNHVDGICGKTDGPCNMIYVWDQNESGHIAMTYQHFLTVFFGS